MNELKVISEQEVLGKEFKIYGSYQNPLFLAKDVALFIEHSDVSTMVRNVDDDEKVTNNVCTLGGVQKSLFLTENGLYEVLMQSRKPIAKQFKKEVKKILKEIRTKGGYVGNDDLFLDTYFPFVDDSTRVVLKSSLETIRKQNEIIENQKKEIEYKEDVIIGLVDDISVSDKRQILNRVVRKGGKEKVKDRWSALYREFNNKYHINLDVRLEAYNETSKPKLKNKLDYVDKVMGKIPELYEIATKLYENDVKELVQEMYELNQIKK